MRKYKKKHNRIGKFRSPLEKEHWDRLNRIKNKPFNMAFEKEKLKYFIPKNYVPDIVLTFPNNRKLYLEIKGYLRYEDQQKMRAVKTANPDLDIRFVFPADKPVHRSKMLNSEWCDKYDFKYCIGKIPRGWLQ